MNPLESLQSDSTAQFDMVEDSQGNLYPDFAITNERVGKMTANLRCLWVGLLTCMVAFSTATVSAQQIQWAKSLEEAQARAAAENKVVQLHFWATWCGPCRQLESFVFPVADIADKMNRNVVAVKVDTEKHPELAKKYAISKIPQDVFLGADGEILFRRISPTNSQNYGIMLDTALKIAAQSTRQSQMAVEAIASIGQQQTSRNNQSMFLGAEAAAAGNARQSFSAPANNGLVAHGATGQLPAATVNYGASAATNQIADSVQKLSQNIETKMPTTQFPSPTLPAPKMPEVKNAFVNHQQVNNSTSVAANGSQSQTITNPNFPVGDIKGQLDSQMNSMGKATDQLLGAVRNSGATATLKPQSALKPQETVNQFAMNSAVTPAADEATPIATVDTQPNTATQVAAVEASSEPVLGLDGYCPVSLLRDQKWVKGDSNYGRIHRGKLYLFANAAAADQFFAAPDALSPALAGFDPVTFATSGRLVDGERKYGVFCETDGQTTIVLFESAENRDRFKADRELFLQRIATATAAADQR